MPTTSPLQTLAQCALRYRDQTAELRHPDLELDPMSDPTDTANLIDEVDALIDYEALAPLAGRQSAEALRRDLLAMMSLARGRFSAGGDPEQFSVASVAFCDLDAYVDAINRCGDGVRTAVVEVVGPSRNNALDAILGVEAGASVDALFGLT